jgi:glycosyltransferase involved in cell wall biosynthesis
MERFSRRIDANELRSADSPSTMGRRRPLATGKALTAEPIEVVLPAHNEGGGIGLTLREFYQVVNVEAGLPIRFLVCEDGSTDNTCDVVREVGRDIPVRLLSFAERKGYSKAVVDGFRATVAGLVGFIDSDGQCDPKDFKSLVDAVGDYDIVIGYRNPRMDSRFRKLISGAFGIVYRALFPVRLKDPSCPYLVVRREALMRILRGNPGILRQGFWWEFNARAQAAGLRVRQVPVTHRVRTAGTTQVYTLSKIPAIAAEHLRGLFALRSEIRQLPAE